MALFNDAETAVKNLEKKVEQLEKEFTTEIKELIRNEEKYAKELADLKAVVSKLKEGKK